MSVEQWSNDDYQGKIEGSEKSATMALHPHRIIRTGVLNEPIGVRRGGRSALAPVHPHPLSTLVLFSYPED
jgi:hypothetical protein